MKDIGTTVGLVLDIADFWRLLIVTGHAYS